MLCKCVLAPIDNLKTLCLMAILVTISTFLRESVAMWVFIEEHPALSEPLLVE